MSTPELEPDERGPSLPRVFEAPRLAGVFSALRERGHRLLGPTVRDGAIVYDEIATIHDLPVGRTDVQEAGHYRLAERDDGAYFGYVVGPQSPKKYLFVPEQRLWSGRRTDDGGFSIDPEPPSSAATAFIGVRACELAAMGIQDVVFTGDEHRDPHYAAAREAAFIIAVNCVQAALTCFCVSMKTGPKARGGDLVLTEVVTEERHYFVATAYTDRGREVLDHIEHKPATADDLALASAHEARAIRQTRRMDTHGLAELLAASHDDPHWDAVAQRCLACANCTMVCPTCFCSTVEDVVDLAGREAQRVRKWDSCFNADFTYLHGGPVRKSTSSRYRQWMTHKLSTWREQFGTSGCVGCGRCITWCPAGIDITAEAATLRAKKGGQP